MTQPISNLTQLLRSMEPALNEGVYAYCALPLDADIDTANVLALFRETEALTVIVKESVAQLSAWPVLFRAAWITLTVHSDLEAVGLTAAFSVALGNAGISCNVVAAAHHDHVFVPLECASDAMAALKALQQAH